MKTLELKTNVWKQTQPGKHSFRYDETLDTALIFFTEDETERIITHFVDENVALLFRDSDKEIVGLRIEYFQEEFVKKISDNGWKLSETGEKIDDIDLSFKVKTIEVQKVVTTPLNPRVEQFTIPRTMKRLTLERV